MLLTPCPHCGNLLTEQEFEQIEKIKLRVGESRDKVRCSKCANDQTPGLLNG